MSLPASWIEALFGRLTLRYGVAFTRQWADLDIAAVKADWCDVLSGFDRHPESIRYALENLPTDWPPTAMQFRAICRSAPDVTPRLEAPEVKADPERVKAVMSRIAQASESRKSQSAECAMRIRQIAESRGGRLSPVQRHVLEACERVALPESVVLGSFKGVPADMLPPAMRGAV